MSRIMKLLYCVKKRWKAKNTPFPVTFFYW